jgi:enoyl-CoA hydratase
MNDTVLITSNEGIVTVTINRPKALNAINADVMQALNDWFGKEYQSIEGLKGVIVTGSGEKAFVAGADIKGFTELTAESGSQVSKFGQDTYFLIENFHVPVIAAVNGFALGGGCELAMACHMRIASTDAKFGLPEVSLGLIPGYGGTQRLPQLVGKAKAMELTLTGGMVSSEEAQNIGLVNYCVEKEELINSCLAIFKKTKSKGPLAISKAITAINAYYNNEVDGYKTEYSTFGELLISDECKEGVKAFIEKRKANF